MKRQEIISEILRWAEEKKIIIGMPAIENLADRLDRLEPAPTEAVDHGPVRRVVEMSLEDCDALYAIRDYFRFTDNGLSPLAFYVLERITEQYEPKPKANDLLRPTP